jgi:hypothetical protein
MGPITARDTHREVTSFRAKGCSSNCTGGAVQIQPDGQNAGTNPKMVGGSSAAGGDLAAKWRALRGIAKICRYFDRAPVCRCVQDYRGGDGRGAHALIHIYVFSYRSASQS